MLFAHTIRMMDADGKFYDAFGKFVPQDQAVPEVTPLTDSPNCSAWSRDLGPLCVERSSDRLAVNLFGQPNGGDCADTVLFHWEDGAEDGISSADPAVRAGRDVVCRVCGTGE